MKYWKIQMTTCGLERCRRDLTGLIVKQISFITTRLIHQTQFMPIIFLNCWKTAMEIFGLVLPMVLTYWKKRPAILFTTQTLPTIPKASVTTILFLYTRTAAG